MVSIPACHAGDRGSIPRRGGYILRHKYYTCMYSNLMKPGQQQFKKHTVPWPTPLRHSLPSPPTSKTISICHRLIGSDLATKQEGAHHYFHWPGKLSDGAPK